MNPTPPPIGSLPYPGAPPYPPLDPSAYPPGAPQYPPGVGAPPYPPQEHRATIQEPQTTAEPPPANTYPCGCGYPGDHKPDCMWSLWEQMQSNYVQTKNLMSKFMSNVNTIQSGGKAPGADRAACECPPGCHGRDLGEAMGLQQMRGVTVPWQSMLFATPQPGPVAAQQTGYPVESESRRMMEEQRRIKNTWAQFLNIFDMALDLANDVSKDRWEAARRRRERARLERLQRLEELQRERAERASTEPKELHKKEDTPPKKDENKTEEKKVQEVKTTEEEETPIRPSTDTIDETPEDARPSDEMAETTEQRPEVPEGGGGTVPSKTSTPEPEVGKVSGDSIGTPAPEPEVENVGGDTQN